MQAIEVLDGLVFYADAGGEGTSSPLGTAVNPRKVSTKCENKIDVVS